MGLWRFCFGSGLDTASLALPLSWGGCGASLPWVFEGVRLGTHSYLPGQVSLAIFALGQVYCQIYKALESPFLPLLAWYAGLRNYFFLSYLFLSSSPCSSTLPYVSRDVGGDASFHPGLVIHPFPLFCLTHVCELLEGFRQSRLRLASCSLVGGCFLFLPFSLAPFCILYHADCGAG